MDAKAAKARGQAHASGTNTRKGTQQELLYPITTKTTYMCHNHLYTFMAKAMTTCVRHGIDQFD
eukprot:382042-Amorphochlora_amoeboformis.AAC.1